MSEFDGMVYGTGSNATIGANTQLRDFYWQRKALIDAQKEMYFGQLADTESMPKHYGKTIKRYHYLPMLDDRNINDQGIDATAAGDAKWQVTVTVYDPSECVLNNSGVATGPKSASKGKQFVGYGSELSGTTNAAAAKTAALYDALNHVFNFLVNNNMTTVSGTTYKVFGSAAATFDQDNATNYLLVRNNLATAGWLFSGDGWATGITNASSSPSTTYYTAVRQGGNLYGSSRDVGTIEGKLPTISETGGRKNRVGFTRQTIEGTLSNFGFFDEYTEDALNFDSDDQLMQHITREAIRGANQIVEDKLQIDLLNAANVVMYGGSATSMSSVSGETGATCELTYDMLTKLDTILNDNLCPKDTKLISGSRMVDTRTVPDARYIYIGAELKPTLLKMKDYHNMPAFIPVHQYANAGNIARGEIGSVGHFRFIENPNMMHWEAKGASITNNAGYITGIQADGTEKYNVYPALVVGSNSFTTIGFQTDGNNTKFKILHKTPGSTTADRNDPYGKTGFYSIQWWYGFMAFRPEWIACLKVVAPR